MQQAPVINDLSNKQLLYDDSQQEAKDDISLETDAVKVNHKFKQHIVHVSRPKIQRAALYDLPTVAHLDPMWTTK